MTSNSNSLVGEPSTEVPTIDPDDTCNGKRTGDSGIFRGYCDNPAGEGTDHEGEGRCAECAGNSTGPKTEAGKLKARSNATSHGLTADPTSYHESLPQGEREFVIRVARAVEKRIERNTGSLDFVDEVLARRMAIQLHIAFQASEYVVNNDLIETIRTDDGVIELENRMLDHVRQYDKDLVNNLEKIGATKGTSTEIDALELWRSELES